MFRTDSSKAARARELCRRLRPVIGERADRIWQAYIVESEDGKQQLLEYLELMAMRRLQQDLDGQGAGLVPPSSEETAGEYELGTVTYGGKDMFPFGLREDEWIQHVAVFGRSGAGKTTLGHLLVKRLIERGKPVLILDWKRNYRDLLTQPGFEEMAVYTIGRPVAPLSFNPLIPPSGTNPKTWLKKLISVIAHAYLLGNGVLYLLQETLDSVYEEFGAYDGRVERWPTFRDVMTRLKERRSSGREAGWLSSALRALASLTFGDMDQTVNRDSDNMRALLERPVILELDALTQSDKVFFVQALLLWIHHLRMTEPTREEFKHAIVIEEAHHVLSGERRSLVGGQSVMDLTFREIREYGESLIILDQHPSLISMPALGNTYATICFNLKHRADVNAIAQAMLMEDDEKNQVGSLPIGHAVVRLQGRGERPFTISVPLLPIKKGTITDADVSAHMIARGLLSSRRTQRPPELVGPSSSERDQLQAPVTRFSKQDRQPIDPRCYALLADIDRFPQSGIADRYQRLGISVRQGQRIKAELVEHGLIMESLERTNTGSRRVVRLTEQGALEIGSWKNEGSDRAAAGVI